MPKLEGAGKYILVNLFEYIRHANTGSINDFMEKFRNKYRIKSNRLQGWDYSSDALYFITIVTAHRNCIFGEIQNGRMIYNEYGSIANDEWLKSFEIRQELFLDEYVIMPNHIHAIVGINNNEQKMNIGSTAGDGRDARPCVSTPPPQPAGLQRKPKSVSSFIAGYKSVVMNKIDDFIDKNYIYKPKYNRHNPLWQVNYHDHIIRNDESYHRIKKYIIDNPANWYKDSLF